MNIKKTVKKAAKKNYLPAKKTIPKHKSITAEELANILAENHAKTEAIVANALQGLSAEVRKTSATVLALTKNMGGLNNSFGYLVELIVVPKLRSAINTAGGHTFTMEKVLVDKEITAIIDGEKRDIGEIDMFLFSDTEAMAAEIKAQLQTHHIEKQLDRLQKLRIYEEKTGIVGKKLFGAVAGIYIDPRAKNLALENGLYVVEIREEEDKLDIEKPESRRTW